LCIKKSAKLIEGHSLDQGNKQIFFVVFEIRNRIRKASQLMPTIVTKKLMPTMIPYFALVLDKMTPYFALVINSKF